MRACLQVNLKALQYNIKLLLTNSRKKCSFFCPMVKANGYGAGSKALVEAMNKTGVKKWGVISLKEALEIKNSLPENGTVYISGPLDPGQIKYLPSLPAVPFISNWKTLKALAQYAERKNQMIPFHLKFNTGLNRLGFDPSETDDLTTFIANHSHIFLEGLAFHLHLGEQAAALKANHPMFKKIKLVQKVTHFFKKKFPKNKILSHWLNSSSWFSLFCHSRLPASFGFRPGLCLFGIKPAITFYSKKSQLLYKRTNLLPVLTLKAYVVDKRKIKKGDTVSYGRTWRAQKEHTVAVISIGYADGLPFSLSSRGAVLFRGIKVPIVGSVCMDFTIIDVSQVLKNPEEIKLGEEVVVFGDQKGNHLTLSEQARRSQTIPYELLTRIGPRVRRQYLHAH